MLIAWSLLVFCQVLPGTLSKKESVTALGDTFVLAFPNISEPNICLLIYTLTAEIKVKIHLSNPGSSNHTEIAQLTVQSAMSVTYCLEKSKIPTSMNEYSYHNCLLLTSNHTFGAHVHMYDGTQSLSSFIALPVEAYGNVYVLITHKIRPFFTVVAELSTKLVITFVIFPNATLVADGAVQHVNKHNLRTIVLESYQAFTFMKCFDQRFLTNISLTETKIESLHPVGVISGSCSLIYDECKSPDTADTYADLASEMLLSEGMFGQHFVLVLFHYKSYTDYITIVSSKADTEVKVYINVKEHRIMLARQAQTSALHLGDKVNPVDSGYLVSTKPVMVYYTVSTTCQGSIEYGGPSIMTILPNELFYNTYVWVTPPAVDVRHVISLVIAKESQFSLIRWNNGSIPVIVKIVNENITKSSYNLVTLEIHYNHTQAILAAPFSFGCYFSGIGIGSFLQAAGFQFYEDSFECTTTEDVVDDNKDNDCDGLIDEEYRNEIDDDGDEHVDEDTYKDSKCSMPDRWGNKCLYSCSEFCMNGCERNRGVCFSCVEGHVDPMNYCLNECPAFTYGMYCKGNCSVKCNGRDCFERSEGQCESLDPIAVPANGTTPQPNNACTFNDSGKCNGTAKVIATTKLSDTTKLPTTTTMTSTTSPLDTTDTTVLQQELEEQPKKIDKDTFYHMLMAMVLVIILFGVCGNIFLRLKGDPPKDETYDEKSTQEKERESEEIEYDDEALVMQIQLTGTEVDMDERLRKSIGWLSEPTSSTDSWSTLGTKV